MAFSFLGGVHPRENKGYTAEKPVVDFPASDILVIPLSQHIGAPCQSLVKKGDLVTMGQKIGDGQGLCVPVHASVSGRVKAVERRPHPNGTTVMSVVIENDGAYTLCPDLEPCGDIAHMSSQELIDLIREAGIVGMGGAAFPTHVKLSSGVGKVDTIIVNASECEPYITADDRLLQETPDRVLRGLGVIMRILDRHEAVIAIERNKPKAAEALRQAIEPQSGVRLEILPAKYPQGAEKQLIYAVTGRRVPSGGLPAAVGCAVFNAATCAAICDAVYDGMPLISRILTVSGDILMEPKNLRVPLGTSFNDLLEAVGHSENPYKVLCGGPMMGLAQFDLSVPVIKGTNAMTVLGKRNSFFTANPHCIRCGKCMEACPMGLMPLQMYRAERQDDLASLRAYGVMDCIECGSCAYTCPAVIPLVQSFRAAKQKLRSAAAPKVPVKS